jgi:hypothetical protein
MEPKFPEFKPVELADRGFLHELFWKYQPETSELNFTNVFIWREHYHIQWSMHNQFLLIACKSEAGNCFALPPLGPGNRAQVSRELLQWMRENRGDKDPSIQRADQRLKDELEPAGLFLIEPAREHFDYLYRSEDLIKLSGNKYHAKKNHLNKFRKTYQFSYQPLTTRLVDECLEVAELWCEAKRCHEDLDLMDEARAVREILLNFEALKLQAGVIVVNDRVEAFALGEMLNQNTAVVHIEKANPQIPQAFVVINQQFAEHEFSQVPFINREQDLGDDGLRRAKESYHPLRLVEKFRIRLK